MYFISKGTVEVIINGQVMVTLGFCLEISWKFILIGEGAFFGEIALFVEATRTASIRTLEYW